MLTFLLQKMGGKSVTFHLIDMINVTI